jgi:hypothetical protein
MPVDEMFLRMIELGVGDATDEAWDELQAVADKIGVQQDPIEVLEARALWSLRHGRLEAARRGILAALDRAAAIPNLMEPRLRKVKEQIDAALTAQPPLS